jgi:hypothetical protein
MRKSFVVAGMSIAVVASVVFLADFGERWDAKAPERTQQGQASPAIPLSYAHIPVSVATRALEKEVLGSLGSAPIFQGRTGEISAKLLVDRSFPAILEDVVVTPFKAAGCATRQVIEQCPRQTIRRIGENCIKKLRLSRCFRTLVETTYVPCAREVARCWPEVKEVVESRVRQAAFIKEELLPTSVWLNYKGTLRDIKIQARGQDLSVAARVNTSVSVDIRQGVLGASATVKGAVACDADFTVSIVATVRLRSDASIDIDIKKFDLDAHRLCLPGAVELADLAQLNAALFLHKELFARLLEKPILEAINRQVKKGIGDDLRFSARLVEVGESLRKPLALGKDAWLLVEPQRLLATQPIGRGSGAGNRLEINLGLEANPSIRLGTPRASSGEAQILPLAVVESLPEGIHLSVAGSVPLAHARKELLSKITAYLDRNHAEERYTIGDVDIYQSGERFVVSLSVFARETGDEKGKIYLWATPYLDGEESTLRLRDVHFDVETENLLVKVAAWLLSARIGDLIEDEARFAYGGTLQRIESDLKTFVSKGPSGVFSGTLDSISGKEIWVGEDAINILAEAVGTGSFELTPGE